MFSARQPRRMRSVRQAGSHDACSSPMLDMLTGVFAPVLAARQVVATLPIILVAYVCQMALHPTVSWGVGCVGPAAGCCGLTVGCLGPAAGCPGAVWGGGAPYSAVNLRKEGPEEGLPRCLSRQDARLRQRMHSMPPAISAVRPPTTVYGWSPVRLPALAPSPAQMPTHTLHI